MLNSFQPEGRLSQQLFSVIWALSAHSTLRKVKPRPYNLRLSLKLWQILLQNWSKSDRQIFTFYIAGRPRIRTEWVTNNLPSMLAISIPLKHYYIWDRTGARIYGITVKQPFMVLQVGNHLWYSIIFILFFLDWINSFLNRCQWQLLTRGIYNFASDI